MFGGMSGVRARIPMQDYRSIPLAVVIWAAEFNTQTERQTDRQTDRQRKKDRQRHTWTGSLL